MIPQAYIDEVKKLALHYRIRRLYFVTFPLGSNVVGCHNDGEILMSIREKRPRCRFISTFFHELGHYHCYRHGIWKRHSQTEPNPSTYRYLKLMSVKVERWVDRWAAREMKRWYPRMRYSFNYYHPSVKELKHKSIWERCHT
jgi:hypothetical protein